NFSSFLTSELKIKTRTRSGAASVEAAPIGSMVRIGSESAMTKTPLRRRHAVGNSIANNTEVRARHFRNLKLLHIRFSRIPIFESNVEFFYVVGKLLEARHVPRQRRLGQGFGRGDASQGTIHSFLANFACPRGRQQSAISASNRFRRRANQ